ncbi:anaerobic sulfatase maturase [Providencia sp. PROV031]|uniref:anaerobic sulfatase maturase n=1 Tax=Providencia sp. PROV031 TaxID=2949763 RepID=UPI00234AC516|nr:anaerobic sulfatase maturase [Providencia sp. PROV031]
MHFTIKPTSFQCNIKCDYCFYLEKEHIFQHKNWMNNEVLEKFIKKYIDACNTKSVYFTWQGGEPTMAGISFYKKVIELQNKYKGSKQIFNALQTNGLLINDDWCQFLKKNNFLIGISIDGPEDLHNKYRKTGSGKGTFKKVLNAIELFKQYNIEFNTLTVINNYNVNHPIVVYEFLKEIGSKHIQFIELLETDVPNEKFIGDIKFDIINFSVPSESYGIFMSEIFKRWIKYDFGDIFIRQFESFISCFLGNGHSSCIFQPVCHDNFVIESNGDIYECDHFVYPDFKITNIDEDIENISTPKLSFEKANLSKECLECDYKSICNGGCPKHRINKATNANISYFCHGYKKMFSTIVPYLNAMTSLAKNNIPLNEISKIADQIEAINKA